MFLCLDDTFSYIDLNYDLSWEDSKNCSFENTFLESYSYEQLQRHVDAPQEGISTCLYGPYDPDNTENYIYVNSSYQFMSQQPCKSKNLSATLFYSISLYVVVK